MFCQQKQTSFLFIPQFLLSVLWFVLSLLSLTFLRFKPATLGTALGVITDYCPATRNLLYRKTDFLLLFSFYLHCSLSSCIFFSPATAFNLPLFISNLYFEIISLFSVCAYFWNSFTSPHLWSKLVLLQHLSFLFPLFWRMCPRTGHSCVLAAYSGEIPCLRCSLDFRKSEKTNLVNIAAVEESLYLSSFAVAFWNYSPLLQRGHRNLTCARLWAGVLWGTTRHYCLWAFLGLGGWCDAWDCTPVITW